MSYTGSCQCGNIKYAFTSEPIHRALCYCPSCQRLTASTGTFSLIIPRPSFTCTSGTPKIHSRKTDSGADVHNHLCGDCGTTCWGTGTILEEGGGLLTIRSGTLDDLRLNERWRPTIEVYCKDKYTWMPAVEGAAAFEGMMPRVEKA